MKIENSPKVAIVTGGASGIGLAIATEFVRNGIFTVIVGRDQHKLENAKNALGELCEAISCDLGNLKLIPGLISDIAARHKKIDILVNNAGINQKKEFWEVTDEEFDNVINTNLRSVFAVSREVVKVMIEAKSGSIINISSMASQYGIPKVIAYTASKTALDGMTRAMSTELAPKGIRVNSIAPGFIATEMSAKALNSDPERKQRVMSRTPIGYLGETADIGAAAFFLASDAAKYITGAILPVDGGNSVGF